MKNGFVDDKHTRHLRMIFLRSLTFSYTSFCSNHSTEHNILQKVENENEIRGKKKNTSI
jgi:hypothetical protein